MTAESIEESNDKYAGIEINELYGLLGDAQSDKRTYETLLFLGIERFDGRSVQERIDANNTVIEGIIAAIRRNEVTETPKEIEDGEDKVQPAGDQQCEAGSMV